MKLKLFISLLLSAISAFSFSQTKNIFEELQKYPLDSQVILINQKIEQFKENKNWDSLIVYIKYFKSNNQLTENDFKINYNFDSILNLKDIPVFYKSAIHYFLGMDLFLKNQDSDEIHSDSIRYLLDFHFHKMLYPGLSRVRPDYDSSLRNTKIDSNYSYIINGFDKFKGLSFLDFYTSVYYEYCKNLAGLNKTFKELPEHLNDTLFISKSDDYLAKNYSSYPDYLGSRELIRLLQFSENLSISNNYELSKALILSLRIDFYLSNNPYKKSYQRAKNLADYELNQSNSVEFKSLFFLLVNYLFEHDEKLKWIQKILAESKENVYTNNLIQLKKDLIRPTVNFQVSGEVKKGDNYLLKLDMANVDKIIIYRKAVNKDFLNNNLYDFKIDFDSSDAYETFQVRTESGVSNEFYHYLKTADLDYGYYAFKLIAINSELDSIELTQIIKITDFEIINISNDHFFKLLVLNKQSGEPYKKVKYTLSNDGKIYKLSSDGIIDLSEYKGRVVLNLANGKDTVSISNYAYLSSYSKNKAVSIITEKNIYKRGQLIRGKAIIYEKTKEKYSLIINQNFKLELSARGKPLTDIQIKTNEFGSAEFSYLIPNDFSGDEIIIKIVGIDIYSTIRVEDYKRPRFEVVYDEQLFQVNEDSVVGVFYLKSFSGVNPEIQKAEISIEAQVGPNKWVRYPHFTKEIIKDKVYIRIKKFKNPAISSLQSFYSFNIDLKINDFTGETFEINQRIDKEIPDIKIESLKADNGKLIGKIKINNFQKLDLSVDSMSLDIEEVINLFDPSVKWIESNSKIFLPKEELESKFKNKFKFKPIFKLTYNQQIHKIDDSSFLFMMDYPSSINHFAFKVEFDNRNISAYQNDPIILFDTIIQFKIDENKINYLSNPKNRDLNKIENLGTKTKIKIASHKNEKLSIYLINENQFILLKSLKINPKYQEIELKHPENKGSNHLLFVYHDRLDTKKSIEYELVQNPIKQLRNLKDTEIKIKTIKHISGDTMEIELSPISTNNTADFEVLIGVYDKSLNYFVNNNFSPVYDYFPIELPNINPIREIYYYYPYQKTNYYNLPILGLPIFNFYDFSNFSYTWDLGDDNVMAFEERAFSKAPEPNGSYIQPSSAPQISDIVITSNEEEKIDDKTISRSSEEKLILFQSVKIKAGESKKIKIQVPEVLSNYRIQSFTHSKDFEYDYSSQDFTSYKPLAILPQWPRFIRKGEQISLSARISNETDSSQNIKVGLFINNNLFWDSSLFLGKNSSIGINSKSIEADNLKGLIQNIKWEIRSSAFFDAENMEIPLISNQVLVINSSDFYIKSNDSKTIIQYPDLEKSLNNPKHKIEEIAVEITTNPAWLALMNLGIPQGNDENLDYWLNKYYLISSLQDLIKRNPGMEKFIKEKATELLLGFPKDPSSNPLLMNDKWKNILLSETPWDLDAENEKIFSDELILFLNENLNTEKLEQCLEKIEEFSDYQGTFTWIKGSSFYSYYQSVICAYYLNKSSYRSANSDKLLAKVKLVIKNDLIKRINNAKSIYEFTYVDIYAMIVLNKELLKPEYASLINFYSKDWNKLNTAQLIAYSEFLNLINKSEESKKVYNYVKSFFKIDKDNAVYLINQSFSGNAFSSELSVLANMYRLSFSNKDYEFCNKLFLRLLKLKRGNKWQFNQGTVDAALCLLDKNPNLESPNKILGFKIGDKEYSKSLNEEISPSYGTGYLKAEVKEPNIKKGMNTLEIYNAPSPRFASDEWKNSYSFVSFYYSYKAKMDDVVNAGSSLKINKVLYLESPQGNKRLKHGDTVKLGSKILVSLEIESNIPLNYVYAFDKKSSSVESTSTLSGFKFTKNLYWYEKSMDQEQRFFINSLPAGKSVIRYSLFAQNRGSFFMGTAGIASFYAPEYSGTSSGIRLVVID